MVIVFKIVTKANKQYFIYTDIGIIYAKDFDKYEYTNAKLINGVLVSDVSTIEHDKGLLLFHGSKYGLKNGLASINLDRTRDKVDFGKGFYTNRDKKMAESWICDERNAKIYAMFADVSNLKVYKFKDMFLWTIFIGVNRGVIDLRKYNLTVQNLIVDLQEYDLIIGDIADDELYNAFNSYVEDYLSIEGLRHCLQYINLGTQYVFKTQKALATLEYLYDYSLTESQIKAHRRTNETKSANVSGIISKARISYKYGKYRSELEVEYERIEGQKDRV